MGEGAPIESTPWKRVIRIPEMIESPDPEKVRFPGGVVCELAASPKEDSVRRIELVARDRQPLGILRYFPIAYTSHPSLLDLSRRSNSVVEVRGVERSMRQRADRYSQGLVVVKRFPGDGELGPRIMVSERWLDRVGLEAGDRVILSNPLSDFLVPPPIISDATRGMGS